MVSLLMGVTVQKIILELDAVTTAADVSAVSAYVGEPIYQTIDQSKLVPLLTAALQEEIGKRRRWMSYYTRGKLDSSC